MVRLTKRSDVRGFTLVELLIVIAIIGVLSTIGIPAFKRMIQKSKKTEAKTSLAALYTAEQAFFSEYGAYGTNLFSIGFAVDANSTGKTSNYSVGFPGGASCNGTIAIIPTAAPADTAGAPIQSAFPAYFTAALPQPIPFNVSLSNTWDGLTAQCLTSLSAVPPAAAAYTLQDKTPVSASQNITVFTYTPGVGAAPGSIAVYAPGKAANGYLASAAGVISSNSPRNSGNPKDYDYWTIDFQRTLRNLQDGVK